nr:hypothetical protein [Tanacetum cinerariifolium]
LFEGMLAAREVEEEGIVEEQVQANDIVVAAVQETVAEDVAEDVANEAIPSTPTPLILPSPPSHDIPSTTQDVFNQWGMIDDLDKDERIDEGIELVVNQVKDADIVETEGRHVAEQAEKQAEIYHLDLDHPSKPSIPAVAPTVAAAYTRRRKRVIIRDPEEELSSKTLADTPKLKDNGKARFDANMRFLFKSREEMEEEDREVLKSINETPAQKAAKRRKLV